MYIVASRYGSLEEAKDAKVSTPRGCTNRDCGEEVRCALSADSFRFVRFEFVHPRENVGRWSMIQDTHRRSPSVSAMAATSAGTMQRDFVPFRR